MVVNAIASTGKGILAMAPNSPMNTAMMELPALAKPAELVATKTGLGLAQACRRPEPGAAPRRQV